MTMYWLIGLGIPYTACLIVCPPIRRINVFIFTWTLALLSAALQFIWMALLLSLVLGSILYEMGAPNWMATWVVIIAAAYIFARSAFQLGSRETAEKLAPHERVPFPGSC